MAKKYENRIIRLPADEEKQLARLDLEGTKGWVGYGVLEASNGDVKVYLRRVKNAGAIRTFGDD